MRSLASLSVLASLLVASCQAFAPRQSPISCQSSTLSFPQKQQQQHHLYAERSLPSMTTILFSSPEDSNDKESFADNTTPIADPTPVPVEEESGVMLDVPSPLLLASSIIFAIVATGCLFDLLGGSPAYGFAPSAAVVLLGGPLSIFLFVSAIAKGKKETEEDDEAFKKSGGGML